MTDDVLVQDVLRQLVERKFGERIKYTYQCEALEQAVYEATGLHIGLTTLKRIFSLVSNEHRPRVSTLDILARYVGYDDYEMLCKDEVHKNEISSFSPVESIESEVLTDGDIVVVEYCPNRRLKLRCLGSGSFEVQESIGSKLSGGDTVRISQFAKGFELIVTEVVRDGRSLGGYVGAKQGGLTDIKLYKREG